MMEFQVYRQVMIIVLMITKMETAQYIFSVFCFTLSDCFLVENGMNINNVAFLHFSGLKVNQKETGSCRHEQ